MRQPHGVCKGGAIRHEGGSGENALAMGRHDTRVDIPGETKIVRVDDQR